MRPHWLLPAALLCLGLGTTPVWAGSLYKQVDPEGRIVLGDTPHPGWRTLEVIQTPDSNPDEAAATRQRQADKAREDAAVEQQMNDRVNRQESAYAELQAALEGLREAEAAREAGREPLPGERQGTVRIGRSMLMPEYEQRQATLEAAVASAKQRLEAARRAWNDVR